MGSREEGGQAQAKPVAGAATPALVNQDVPSTPCMYPDWPSMAAYYGGPAAAGTPPAFFSPPSPSPYMWGGQHLLPPYGTPVSYHPAMYPPGMYPHPAIAPGPTATPSAEMEDRPEVKEHNSAKKIKGAGCANRAPGKPANGVKETCSNANDDTSLRNLSNISDGSGTEGSSNAGDQPPNQKDGSIVEKRSLENMNSEGKMVLTSPATSLNIGMDIWNGSHASSVPMKERHVAVNIAPSVAPIIGRDVVPGNQWVQDERELKRQKRKESNRESARRSRQRKQQECEELAKKADELASENNELRSEIDQVKQQCKLLESANMSMREEFGQIGAPPSTTEGNNNNSSLTQSSRQ